VYYHKLFFYYIQQYSVVLNVIVCHTINMRHINEIVIHHSVTPRNLSLERSVVSFNATHKVRLYQKYQQPLGGTDTPYIAYHYVVSEDGRHQATRQLSTMGYHASNWKVNQQSIGICLTGNFDTEKPSEAQLATLAELIKGLKLEFPDIVKVSGHRHYASKSCPGKNFTDEMIEDFNKLLTISDLSEWQTNAADWAIKNKVSNGSKPLENVKRVEVMEMFRKYDSYKNANGTTIKHITEGTYKIIPTQL
jgi:N-acetyl-anhydromuramyl-L-alanine amidase AmpD